MKSPMTTDPVSQSEAAECFVEGTLTSDQKIDFVFGPTRLHSLRRLTPPQKAHFSSLLAQKKLATPELVDLIHGLAELASDAGAEISAHCFSTDPEGLSGNTPTHWEIKELLLEEILKRSLSYPATALEARSDQEGLRWQETTAELLIEHLEEGTWEQIPETLTGIDLAAKHYNSQGGFLPAHSPQQVARHFSDPVSRNWRPGATDANPTAPNLSRNPSELARIIQKTHAEGNHPSDPDYLINFVKPYLDPELLIPLEAEAADERIIQKLLSCNDPTRETHLKVAYTAAAVHTVTASEALERLRDRDYQGVADSLPHITEQMGGIARKLHESDARDSNTVAGTWKIWQERTGDFRDLAPICQKILNLTKDLQKAHTQRNKRHHDSLTSDTLHFQAAEALRTATAAVSRIQDRRSQAAERTAFENDIIRPAQARMDTGEGNQALQSLLDAYEQQEAALDSRSAEEERRSHTQAERALDEMHTSGLPLQTIFRMEREPTTAARLHTALRCIEHAGFILGNQADRRTADVTIT